MKRNCSVLLYILLISVTVMSLFSCATTINVKIKRPGNLDLNGAKTIAVLPFEKSPYNPYDYFFNYEDDDFADNFFNSYNRMKQSEERIINYLHDSIEKALFNSVYINLVNYIPTETALKYNRDIPVDIFITGEVVSFKVHDNIKKIKKPVPEIEADKVENQKESTESESKEPESDFDVVYDFQYLRDVQFVFKYEIIDGRTFEVISFDTVSIDKYSDVVDEKKNLPDPFSLVSAEIDSFVLNLMKDIQPYDITKSITLLEDKSKNPLMENADKLAKDGSLKQSYDSFLSIYNDTNLFEAGYNSAMLLFAMGQLNEAEKMLKDVYEKTGNPNALDSLYDIQNEIKQAERLNKQINNKLR